MRYVFILILIYPFILCMSQTERDNCQYVDLFIGTGGDCGQMDPSATIPYSMIKVGPDAIKKSHVGYDYNQTMISGFSINRASGTGCSGAGGNLSVLPSDGFCNLKIVKGTEYAVPGYYETLLSNGVRAYLSASDKIAYERYEYPQSENKYIYIDFSSSFGGIDKYYYSLEDKYICGKISSYTTCETGIYSFYFAIDVNVPYIVKSKDEHSVLIESQSDTSCIELRIAISPISTDYCKVELQNEKRSFENIKNDAYQVWKELLNRVNVSGEKNDEKVMFYTSLYRSFLSPVNVTTSDGYIRNTKGAVEKVDFVYYSGWSLWDTYRTKFPLLILLDAERMDDVGNSLLLYYTRGKKLWSTNYEVTPTTRTDHAPIILLDMLEKGIKLDKVRMLEAYDFIVDEVYSLPLKSPDQYLEAAYDFWALGRISDYLDKKNNVDIFISYSDSLWINTWKDKFMHINDSTFDVMHGDGLYEGTLWQYRWAVPFNIERLISLAGGKDTFIHQLEYFFEHGLYNHGNQPDIHAAYLFSVAGNSSLTKKWINRILTKPMKHCYGTHKKFKKPYYGKTYSNAPDGYIPEMDDDDGTMSAWYVMSAMGIFPLTPGTDNYVLTEPLFDNVTIDYPDGKQLIIRKVKGDKASVTYNGLKLNDYSIEHSKLHSGILEFVCQ